MDPQPTPAPAPPAPAPTPAPPVAPAPPAPQAPAPPAAPAPQAPPVAPAPAPQAPPPAPAPHAPAPPQGEPTIAALQAQIVRLEAQGVMLRSGVAGLDDPDVEGLFLEKFKASGEQSFSGWFAKVKAAPPAVLKPFLTPAAPAPGAAPGTQPAPVRSAINPGAQTQTGTAAVYTPEQIKAILSDPEQAKVHGAAIRAQLGLPGAPPSRTFNPSQFGKS